MNVIVGSERPRRNGANYGDEGDARGATREAAEDSDDTADRESTAPGGGQRVALAGTTIIVGNQITRVIAGSGNYR